MVGLSLKEMERLAEEKGEPPYRGRQLFRWIYANGCRNLQGMSNLPLRFRQALSESHQVEALRCESHITSREDGSSKFLFSCTADERTVESVHIPEKNRQTVCLSSQVGCPLGCAFCATGKNAFERNLSAGEIVDQLLLVQHVTKKKTTHVVLMGMGEPLLNYEEVSKACTIINDSSGIDIGARRITISTAGWIPGIRRLMEEGRRYSLAVSINAADPSLRASLMPVERMFPLDELMRTLKEYVRRTGRPVTIEYVLLRGVNDSAADAKALRRLVRSLRCKVNLIPYNSVPGTRFEPPKETAIDQFLRILAAGDAPVTVRRSKGRDIHAACGQLKAAGKARGRS